MRALISSKAIHRRYTHDANKTTIDQLPLLTCNLKIERLDRIFTTNFGYNCRIARLKNHRDPQVGLNLAILKHIEDHDNENTLLIVYYTGHGAQVVENTNRRLEISALVYRIHRGQPKLTEIRTETFSATHGYAPTAFWDEAEKPLRRNTSSDTLVLLDCCYASTAGLKGRNEEFRTYQLLAASATEGYTTGPGEKSFTTALCDSLEELLHESKGETFPVIKLSERISTKRTQQAAVMWDRLERYKRSIELGRLVRNVERESSFQREIPEQASLLLRFSLGTNKLSDAEIGRLARHLPEACKQAKIHVRRMEWVKMEHRNPEEVFRRAVKTIIRINRRQSNPGKVQKRRNSPERKERTPSDILALSAPPAAVSRDLAQSPLDNCNPVVTRWKNENPSNLPDTPPTSTTDDVPGERSGLLPHIDCSEVTSELDYDSLFECSGNSNSIQSESGIHSADFEPLKKRYIEMLVQSFVSKTRPSGTDDGRSKRSEDDRSQTKGKGKGKHRATSPALRDTDQSRQFKRARRRRNAHSNGDDESEGEADKNNPVTNNDDARLAPENGRMFACPFVKRFPGRYFKCYGHMLKDVPRVKYHLSRVHLLPIYCPMCSMTFDKEDLRDEHIRIAQCPRKPPIQWEGITSFQRQQLKKRSLSINTPEANWYEVFQILFPEKQLPRSPYIDLSLSGELGMLREHMCAQGPGIWSSILESSVSEELRPQLEAFQSMADEFFPDVVERLLQTWTSQTLSTASLGPEQDHPAHGTLHIDSDGERFQTVPAGNGEHPASQLDNQHSDVIDRMMENFSTPAFTSSGTDWTELLQTEWTGEPTWPEYDPSLYVPIPNLPDQQQAVPWNVGNVDTDNDPGPSAGSGEELDKMLVPNQDQSYNM
jgi:hypothetical protein